VAGSSRKSGPKTGPLARQGCGFQMSPHQCRATNNSKPLFQRKHRRVSAFAMIWNWGEPVNVEFGPK
jgi:hypothetical protein